MIDRAGSSRPDGSARPAGPVLPELDQLAGEVSELLDRMGLGADRIDTRFARTAARHAALPATVDVEGEASYLELELLADEIARRLTGRTGPGGAVGLRLEPGRFAPAAVLGVLRSGAACLPLPQGSARRQERLLSRVGAELVLSDCGLLGDEAPVLKAGPYVLATRPVTGADEARVALPEDTAYLAGDGTAAVGHAQVLALLDATVAELGTGPEDVWAAPDRLLLDAWLPWAPLLSGARLAAVDTTGGAGELCRMLVRREASVLVLPAGGLGGRAASADAMLRMPGLRRVLRSGPGSPAAGEGGTTETTGGKAWWHGTAAAPHSELLLLAYGAGGTLPPKGPQSID